jgi:homoserine dehydrogenase
MKPAKVAIVGFGTIGSGVARLLLEQPERIARRAAHPVELVRVIDPDTSRKRNIDLPEGMLGDDLDAMLADPSITAVVQLIGGLEPARSIMLRILESGKDVVTANKALLAEHGPELFEAARRLGRSIAFEAAVAGGVPIIAAISECLTANQIDSIHAILNGTSNFILTEMEQQGSSYEAAVAEAQQRGYAEADPTMDVDGTDAAQKLAILAHLAFGAKVDWRAIPRIGIQSVTAEDMCYARELGCHIKLLAMAHVINGELELHVSPTLVRQGTPLAGVTGAFNAIRVNGDAVGRLFFQGLGAGQMPTASAVVADLIDTVVGRMAITFKTLNLWSDGHHPPVPLRDPAAVPGRFYLRLNVDDRPGVMASIAASLGEHGISIASLIQHEAPEWEENGTAQPNGTTCKTSATAAKSKNIVPMVIMTHRTTEGQLADAMKRLDTLSCVHPGTIRMRVRD